MPSNKFSISLSKLDYQPETQIHFLTHVPKVLSIADAEVLVSELREVLDSEKPKDLRSFATPVASYPPFVVHEAKSSDEDLSEKEPTEEVEEAPEASESTLGTLPPRRRR